MSRIFLDSNICIYTFDKADSYKSNKAIELISQFPCISSQVIIETYNACSKKLKFSPEVCEENTLFLCDITSVVPINEEVLKKAIFFKRKYRFSFLDSCIVAAAFCAGCTVLFSEDMQHKMVVEDFLTIINPFVQ